MEAAGYMLVVSEPNRAIIKKTVWMSAKKRCDEGIQSTKRHENYTRQLSINSPCIAATSLPISLWKHSSHRHAHGGHK